MTDQEKYERAIKGLECCLEPDCPNDCPYLSEGITCRQKAERDALALLKAQEPVKPVKVNRYMDTDENGDWYVPETYDCGYCGVELHDKANYCHLCGRAVKWE